MPAIETPDTAPTVTSSQVVGPWLVLPDSPDTGRTTLFVALDAIVAIALEVNATSRPTALVKVRTIEGAEVTVITAVDTAPIAAPTGGPDYTRCRAIAAREATVLAAAIAKARAPQAIDLTQYQ